MDERNVYYTDNIADNFEYDEKNDALHLCFDNEGDCITDVIDGMIVWHNGGNRRQWQRAIILDFSIANFSIIDKIRVSCGCKNSIKILQEILRRNMHKDWDIAKSRGKILNNKIAV